MDAEERHGFEGEGFVYLRSPVWWAGIATRKEFPFSPFSFLCSDKFSCASCYRRGVQFCSICLRTSYSCHAIRCLIGPDWCYSRLILLEREAWYIRQAWQRNLPHRIGYHCAACSTGQGDNNSG